MNDLTLAQLRITVEKAVRPLRASDHRKNCIREELLAHLTASFEEEFESERFTSPLRDALHLAEEESRRRQHGFVGTEHVLLGLIGERSGTGAAALEAIGLSADSVRARVDQETDRWKPTKQPATTPRTPRTQQALSFAVDEAKGAGVSRVGIEHLLVGLLREREGLAGKVLAAMGADADRARAALRQVRPPDASTAIDEAGPLQRTLDRFGDPTALRPQLQATVPWTDSIDRCVEWIWFRPGESALHRGVRHGSLVAAVMLVWLCLIGLVVAVRHGNPVIIQALARQAALCVPACFVLTLCFTLLTEAMRRSLARTGRRARAGAALVAVLSLSLIPAFSLALGAFDNHGDGGAVDWIGAVLFTVIIGPLGIYAVAVAHARRLQRREEWSRLSLD